MQYEALKAALENLSEDLRHVYADDTANPGTVRTTPSAGHCAVVALVVQARFGGEIVSTYVKGQSHWFNELPTDAGPVQVDLTGEQFGFDAVQVSLPNARLYEDYRVRAWAHVNDETRERLRVLNGRLPSPSQPSQARTA